MPNAYIKSFLGAMENNYSESVIFLYKKNTSYFFGQFFLLELSYSVLHFICCK